MKFSYRHFKKRTRKSKKASRITRRKSKTRKQKGGANTYNRNIPKRAVVTNPLQWDDNAYYDLAASEELFSVE